MDWNQSRFAYYFDFVLVPVLILLAYLASHGLNLPLAAAAGAGYLAWTFIEYWMHRAVFHRVMRREHWLHHKRPAGYVAAPAWLTAAAHMGALGALGLLLGLLLGYDVGVGAFIGLEAGYMAYIATHDAIHHRRQKPTGWLRRRWDHHMLHHQGAEANFGVVFNFWDRAFGTYWDPRRGRPNPT